MLRTFFPKRPTWNGSLVPNEGPKDFALLLYEMLSVFRNDRPLCMGPSLGTTDPNWVFLRIKNEVGRFLELKCQMSRFEKIVLMLIIIFSPLAMLIIIFSPLASVQLTLTIYNKSTKITCTFLNF